MHEDLKIESLEGIEKQPTKLAALRKRIAELGVRLVELAKANESLKRELTQRKQAEERLARHAYYDNLTDLPNRRLFRSHLRQALALANRNERKVAVLFVDLDHFKAINDSWGHAVGDRLLQSAAKWLKSCLRASDVVARLGGDEFIILLPEIGQAEDATTVAEKLLSALRKPFRIEGREIFTSASIGISLYPDDGDEVEILMKNADQAMYCVKQEGRNNHRLFSRA
jgi:diguanylate cyclase (GGDEF)-like protein